MTKKPSTSTYVLAGMFAVCSLSSEAGIKKTDFNGDGKADLFLSNVFTGDLAGWLISGSTVTSRPSYGTVVPSTGDTTIGIKDANGDGRSDLYWYNVNTGTVSTWLMNGSAISSKVAYGSLDRTQGWGPIGLGDFNADNKSDFLWYNSYTGEIRVWLINGSGGAQQFTYGTLPPSNGWMPIGIKDLNADGKADIFLYNAYTGGTGAYLVYGGSATAVTYGNVDPSQGWTPIGLEDFNGDGSADLLWYNVYSGYIGGWLINGGSVLQGTSYGSYNPNTGWTIAGFSDFNNDRKADFLWYNVYTGGTSASLINGGYVTSTVNFGTLAPRDGWVPMGWDDFNGDGNADLVWRNGYTNATSTWLLNANGILQTANYGPVAASSVWQINIPR